MTPLKITFDIIPIFPGDAVIMYSLFASYIYIYPVAARERAVIRVIVCEVMPVLFSSDYG